LSTVRGQFRAIKLTGHTAKFGTAPEESRTSFYSALIGKRFALRSLRLRPIGKR
jgi:hypothetical protein